ncbi:MAG: hypothetical protein JNG84_00865 [Archangium sp.]|nr:hypothetical protein [Archangium sp.]
MPVPAYEVRRDLELSHASTGAVLTQPSTGKSFALTAEEGWVLHALAETQGSLAAAATLAKVKGLTLTLADLEAIVRRLVGQQLVIERSTGPSLAATVPYEASPLAQTAESPAHQGSTLSARTAELPPHQQANTQAPVDAITAINISGGPLDERTVVPAFRTDLVVRRKSKGLYVVKDPRSGTQATVYDFEVSLARMLDGRRTAAEVVVNGARLGLPVSLETLGKFVRQLETSGFLLPRGLLPPAIEGAPTGSWAPREEWDPKVRELFQSGTRLLNQGRTADAQPLFESVLEIDSQNVEAMEVLARILEPQPPAPAAAPVAAPAAPPKTPARTSPPAAAPPPSTKRAVWPLVLGGVGLMALGAVMSWLILSLQAPEGAVPTVAPPVVPPPAMQAPTALGALDDDDEGPPPPATPKPATPRAAPTRWSSTSATASQAIAATVSADGAGRFTLARRDAHTVATGDPLGTLQLSPAGLKAALAEAKRLVAVLEAERPPKRDALAKARATVKRLTKDKGRATPVTAPAAGRFVPDSRLTPSVTTGQVLGRVVDPGSWTIDALFGEQQPGDGAACTVEGAEPTARARCVVIGTTQLTAAVRVTVHVPAADAPWLDEHARVTVVLTTEAR